MAGRVLLGNAWDCFVIEAGVDRIDVIIDLEARIHRTVSEILSKYDKRRKI